MSWRRRSPRNACARTSRPAEGDRKRALELYTWNTKISAAFYGPLQGLEIALRNAIHQQLTRCYSAAWYDNPAVGLDLGGRGRIADAKRRPRIRGTQRRRGDL